MTASTWDLSIDEFLKRNEVCVLGLPFDPLTEQQALENIVASAQQKRPCFFSTPNLNFVVSSLSSALFFDSVCASNLSVADGMPLVLVSKLMGENLPERVSGSGLFEHVMNRKEDQSISVFFFGGDPGVGEEAAAKLEHADNGLLAAGFLDPGRGSVDDMSSASVIEQINNANPDFIVVALGAAKGQEWILSNKDKLNAPVVSHLGAVINFVAGNIKRAPEFWQKLGLEWVWRTLQEPRLAKRYAQDGLCFLLLLAKTVIPLTIYKKIRWSSLASRELTYSLNKSENDSQLTLSLSGAATQDSLPELKQAIAERMVNPLSLEIKLEELTYGDGYFFAFLLRLHTMLSKEGQNLYISGASKPVVRLAQLYLLSKERWQALVTQNNLSGT